jgi:hypothetical protein
MSGVEDVNVDNPAIVLFTVCYDQNIAVELVVMTRHKVSGSSNSCSKPLILALANQLLYRCTGCE